MIRIHSEQLMPGHFHWKDGKLEWCLKDCPEDPEMKELRERYAARN